MDRRARRLAKHKKLGGPKRPFFLASPGVKNSPTKGKSGRGGGRQCRSAMQFSQLRAWKMTRLIYRRLPRRFGNPGRNPSMPLLSNSVDSRRADRSCGSFSRSGSSTWRAAEALNQPIAHALARCATIHRHYRQYGGYLSRICLNDVSIFSHAVETRSGKRDGF